MEPLLRELRFFWSVRSGPMMLAALMALSVLAVGWGLQNIARLQEEAAKVYTLQAVDDLAVARHASDPGDAAYYTSHVVHDAPGPMAFAALGQTDIAPSILRIRALALEGQIHENEASNPELSLPGRLDFAFVLVYIAPLILIALLHDTWSSEREAGRLTLLSSTPRSSARLWAPRVVVRSGLVIGALLAPLIIGSVLSGAAATDIAIASLLAAAMVAFWTLVSTIVAARGPSSTVNAATLAAIWFGITLVAPASANLAINALVPIPNGAAIARENREAVHDGWDLPKDVTMQRFFEHHPEWADTPPVTTPFHWKWYYAFQHLGDVHVAEASAAYREGIAKREEVAGTLSLALPPIAIQRALHRIADTDVEAQLDFQDSIRRYHADLRRFYYPYIFEGRRFEPTDYALAPRFVSAESQ